MTTETDLPKQGGQKTKVIYKGAASAPIYGFGLIGGVGLLSGARRDLLDGRAGYSQGHRLAGDAGL